MKERNSVPEIANDNRAMEGRQFDKDGKDLGDANFHEVAMDFSAEKEKNVLDALSDNVITLEEQQVKNIAKADASLGAKAYRQLLNRYPSNEHAEEWRKAAEHLEKN